MAAPFRRLVLSQFEELVRLFDFTRQVTSFHVHHTYIPRRSDFRGLATIEAMDRVHRTERGFSEIAQHITLAPDGIIWTGRSWNKPPASAIGFNGNSTAGPFMMEMVGNFDSGQEPFDGIQAANAYQIVAILLRRFDLGTDAIVFHNEMSAKTCPGSSVDKAYFVTEVQKALDSLAPLPAADSERDEIRAQALTGLIEPIERPVALRAAEADGELPEEDETYDQYVARVTAEAGGSRAPECPSAAQLAELVPHVVNLRRGRFAADDLFVSNQSTVDAIFAGLDAQLRDPNVPKPLRLLFWAHGGLVGQRGALCKAHRDLWWWKANGIYPIFFVWHTDLGSALGDAIRRSRAGRRDIFEIPDWIIEGFVRHFLGRDAWDSMKFSAAEASASGGGAQYVAKKVQALVAAHDANLELHAVGHSAGAIFHSHFLRAANVRFDSLQMLAPAIRIDEYTARLEPLLANGRIAAAKIYTMRDTPERADTCARVYHKSLLYLISRGLEDDREEPILGMERFLTRDPVTARRFGISAPSTTGEAVFSPGPRTNATAHGCFDDDIPTMDSVAGAIRRAPRAVSYAAAQGSRRCNPDAVFDDARELPRELAEALAPPPPPLPAIAADRAAAPRATGTRRALCVGIDRYSRDPLSGCVADAELWARTLVEAGFEAPTMLLDEAATRQSILDALDRLLQRSTAGDVVVFQYSGHGTEVDDLDGDELAAKDQALCPIDFPDGHFLIDDDIAEVFSRIPAGVSMTCFLDNCYSGTATRFAVGPAGTRATAGDKPRFIETDAELERKHAVFRRTLPIPRASSSRGPDSMREVVFSACQSTELAWESNGQGDFTRNAVPLLTSASSLTNEQFQDRLVEGFTPHGRQHPLLDCGRAARGAALFTFGAGASDAPQPGFQSWTPSGRDVALQLRTIADVVEKRG